MAGPPISPQATPRRRGLLDLTSWRAAEMGD